MATTTSTTSKGRKPTSKQREDILRARNDGVTTDVLFGRFPKVNREAISGLVEDQQALAAQYLRDHPDTEQESEQAEQQDAAEGTTDDVVETEQPASEPPAGPEVHEVVDVNGVVPSEIVEELLARRATGVTVAELVREYGAAYGKQQVKHAISKIDEQLKAEKQQEQAQAKANKPKTRKTAQPRQTSPEYLRPDGRPKNRVVSSEEIKAIVAAVKKAAGKGQAPNWSAIGASLPGGGRSGSCARNVWSHDGDPKLVLPKAARKQPASKGKGAAGKATAKAA